MGGKTSTQTSAVTVPPDVLARYNSVNNQAQQTASTPFQSYSTNPNAFVAPINAEQTQGIQGTNNFATAAQPYIGAGTAYTLAGSAPVNAAPITGADINQYESPYLQDVLGSTAALLNQNNQQQQSGALGEAIQQGAFGGDRAGIAAANLEQQQNLGNANIYSGIANTGFQTALATAQQQQGVNLGAEQANRGALQQTGASLANLGTTAQSAGLQGAQAEQAAGATQQQTTQAGDTALYNQFLQKQSYPFQVDQFLANIAEGTGALSGSTTTTTQPQSIFSDERLKEDVQVIGKTFGGQNVVAFRYKNDPTKRIGLIAQDVEKRHPEAVHEVGGFKAVDYDKATQADADKGHFYKGGLVPANDDRQHRTFGGTTSMDPTQLGMLEEGYGTYGNAYGPYSAGGLYGSQASAAPRGGGSYVPQANLPVGRLAVAAPAHPAPSVLSELNQAVNLGTKVDAAANTKFGQSALKSLGSLFQPQTAGTDDADDGVPFRAGGFARQHRDLGGSADIYGEGLDIPDDVPGDHSLAVAKPPSDSQSNSLGDIASIGSDIAKILPFIPGLARGGLVPRKGYDDGGNVADDGSSDPSSTIPIVDQIRQLAGQVTVPVAAQIGQLYRDAPSVTIPITDQMRHLHQMQNPPAPPSNAMTALLNAMAGGDGATSIAGGAVGATMPQDSSVLGPTAEQTPGQQVGQRLGQQFGQMVQTAPPPAHHARSATLGSPAVRQAPAQTAPAVPDITADAPPSAAMADVDRNPDLAAPVQATGPLHQPPPSGDDPSSGSPDIIGSALSKLRGMHFDRDAVLPILAGIAGAGAVPTIHPGVALAAGLGAYANAALEVPQREAQIAQTRAQAGLTGAEAFQRVQPQPPPGTMLLPGPGPDGKGFIGPDGKLSHYGVQGEMIGDASALTPNAAGAPVPKGTLHGPVQADYGSGNYTVAPSSDAEASLAQTYKGFDPSQSGVVNRARVFALNPGVADIDASDQKLAQEQIGDPNVNDTMHRQLVQLSTAINSLSPQGFSGVGANFEDRANLVNVYHTYAGMLGIDTGKEDVGTLNNAAIIAKIKALTGTAMANANNERAASIANELSAVLPGGGLQPGAANELLGTLMVQNQRQRDFLPYYQHYVAQNGFSAGVNQAFAHDMTPQYDREQAALPRMMARGKSGTSVAEALAQHPQGVQKIEQGYKRPDGTTLPGFGEGIGRYWR